MATRKSSRVTAKAEARVVTQKERTDDAAKKTTKNVQTRRNVKKQKTSNEDASIAEKPHTSRTKRKSGNMKFAYDIPFDVLLEIFKLLEAKDLLSLSRVSKSLHDSLTSDDSMMVSLWKSSYENIPRHEQPPFCPDDTNIVSYTNFLYGRHCQVCSSIYGRIHHESAFIRACSKCANDCFLGFSHLEPTVRRLCNQWTPSNPKYSRAGELILKEEYSLRLEEYNQALKNKKYKVYVAEREADLRNRASIASLLAWWRRRRQEAQAHTLNAIRTAREADIKKKLEEEGFKADSDAIRWSWSSRVPHARKPHALTDSEWSYIRADILDFFQDIREEQSLYKMKSNLHSHISNLRRFISQWKIRPTDWWIASTEPIASFMKSGLPEETSVDVFQKVKGKIRNVIISWQAETDLYLATLIPRPSGKGKKKAPRNGDTNTLELAATFFKCHWCTEPLSYPRILMHACFVRTDDKEEAEIEGHDENDMEDFEEDVVVDTRTRTRGPRQPHPPMEITASTVLPLLADEYSFGMYAGNSAVTFDEEASNAAREIITVCGEDPKTVSRAQMEQMPRRLECLRCSRAVQDKPRAKSARLVMKWEMAIVHDLEAHYGESPSSEPAWRKIDSEEDLDKAKKAEKHMMTLKKYESLVSCNRCSREFFSLQEQLYHLTSMHHIDANIDAVIQHFTPSLDASIKMLHPAVKI